MALVFDEHDAGRPDAIFVIQRVHERERLHLVFKAFETTWQRARPALRRCSRPSCLARASTGEAVDWACARLGAREESRKILFVVSDGSPMDAATALANDAHYLDRHLRDVVRRHEQQGAVEIVGVGVGLDLSPFYARSHVLDLGGAIGRSMFGEVLDLLDSRRRR
jgi:cobaltochelatase CobT